MVQQFRLKDFRSHDLFRLLRSQDYPTERIFLKHVNSEGGITFNIGVQKWAMNSFKLEDSRFNIIYKPYDLVQIDPSPERMISYREIYDCIADGKNSMFKRTTIKVNATQKMNRLKILEVEQL